MLRQVILDTETTGLDPKSGHRIIEIGCVELVDRRLTGRHFHYYINPQRNVDAGAFQVHGLSEEFLADKPVFTDIVGDFLQYIEGAELIIHNAAFDVGFLDHELKLAGRQWGNIKKYCQVIDTLVLARKLHPGQKNNLDALCKRYDIKNFNRELHGALLDSEILAQVYLAMTIGQSSLFTASPEAKKPAHAAQLDEQMSIAPAQPTKVIYANPEELAAHLAYMQRLKAD